MPGYDSPVIMAAGAFVQGSSIELSADGPIFLVGTVPKDEQEAAARVWENDRYLLNQSGSLRLLCDIVCLFGVPACAAGFTRVRTVRRKLLGRT